MKYAISVDPGKFATKCLGKSEIDGTDTEVYFETKYYDLKDGDVELQGNSSLVEYEGLKWIIGEQGELYDTTTTKTSLLHKLAIFTAISRIVKMDVNPIIILTVGCPTTIFKNSKMKEDYRNLIMSNPIITINGLEYHIIFEKIIIKCESSGIVYLEPEVFNDQRVAVIDIGGRNMNFGVYENRVPIASTLFSNNYGSIFLETMIKEELNIHFGFDCDLRTAKKALKEGGIFLNGILNAESVEIVNDTIKKYVKQHIMNSIAEKNVPIQVMPVIAVGGTSNVIIDSLRAEIPQVKKSKAAASQWTNATGFQIVCTVKAGMI